MLVLLSWLMGCTGGPVDDGTGQPPVVEEPPPEPVAAKVLHRLNRAELDNAFRDLLGPTQVRASANLPADEQTSGLDNMAASLSVSVSHLAGLELAVDAMLDEYFGRDVEQTIEYDEVRGVDPGVQYFGEGVVFQGAYVIRDGSLEVVQPTEYDGNFVLESRIYTFGEQTAEVEITLDNEVIDTVTVDWTRADDMPVPTVQLELEPGLHRFGWRLLNPDDADVGFLSMQVTGPTDPRLGPTTAFVERFDCTPETDPTCAERVLTTFASQAWRRPLTADEVTYLMGAYQTAADEGVTFRLAMQHAFKVVLLDPRFVYRFEQDPEGVVGRLSSHEIASRLSFFLWSSIPDDTLFEAAEANHLAADEAVLAETDRMLATVKTQALVENLAGQWLDLRKLEQVRPSVVVYPAFSDALQSSMRRELELLAEDFFLGRISLDRMITSHDRWIDANLAEHYGVPWPDDDGWVKMTVSGVRPGLLGSAGWLTLTSNPDSPNTVTRGKWVLEHLLCSEPPPPPPDVEGTPIEPVEGSSVREQEEAQRSPVACQSCHGLIDPIGFVAGEFDGIGALRTVDELGYPIDTVAEIEGTTMSQMNDVAQWAAADGRLPRCFAEKVFSYAVGRTLTEHDDEALTDITAQFVEGRLLFQPLVRAIVTSEPFLNRSAPELTEAP